MAKIAILFTVLCAFSMVPSSTAFIHLLHALTGHLGALVPDSSVTFETSYGEGNNIQAQMDFFRAVSNAFLDIVASIVHKKVDFLFMLKKSLVEIMARGIGHFKYFVLNNPEFVHNIINTGSELLKLLLTNKPHFAVPHVLQIVKEVAPEPYGTFATSYDRK